MRIIALLAAVYGQTVARQTLRYVARAAKRWRDGDAALAQIELAFARLPRLETDADAYRPFLADRLLDEAEFVPRSSASKALERVDHIRTIKLDAARIGRTYRISTTRC